MAIKQTKESNQQSMVNSVKRRLEDMLTEPLLKAMPEELKGKINSWVKEVDSMQICNDNITMIDGEIVDKNEILEIIKKSTGINKWKISLTENLTENELNQLKKTYGIDIKEQNINKHIYSYSTNSRDVVSMVIVTVLPGFFNVDLQTDRVGYSLEKLVTLKEFAKAIAVECC